jgi:nicotinate phosphoribosyltransferase
MLGKIYETGFGLFTDLYQISMAYSSWKLHLLEKEAVFHLYFRKNPFNGGYTIACGHHYVADLLKSFQFTSHDTDYLRTLKGADGLPMFEESFFNFLLNMKLELEIDAVPEGTILFPNQPMLRVKGPLYQAQLLETALLNILNFQSLIATKASRVVYAAGGDQVLEFGMRRAQGIDGALAASRAAYIGGCAATSNVLAGQLFDIPVKGTHAHSWVMAFADEEAAFEAYAEAMPQNCTLLVDTYNTLEGVKKAIAVGQKLRLSGADLMGIRLDSGDLAYLSIEARKLLDEAGFEKTAIVASSDLDEHLISSLKREQGAAITVWGVGTRLTTAYDQPALGGVYKIGAIRQTPAHNWEYALKLSEHSAKVSVPGIQQIRRYCSNGLFVADMVYNEVEALPAEPVMIDPQDATRRKKLPAGHAYTDLLQPFYQQQKVVQQQKSAADLREHVAKQLNQLHPTIQRLHNPHIYPVGLEQSLHQLRTDLILKLRNYTA